MVKLSAPESNERRVLRKLVQDHKGRDNAVTQSYLADALGIPTSTVRSELRRLREERNIPIGNLRDGYFVIRNESELQDYVGHINSEIASKRKTIEHTLEAFDAFDGEIEISDGGVESQTPTYDCQKCGNAVERANAKWPKQGDYEDQVLCRRCYGAELMNR